MSYCHLSLPYEHDRERRLMSLPFSLKKKRGAGGKGRIRAVRQGKGGEKGNNRSEGSFGSAPRKSASLLFRGGGIGKEGKLDQDGWRDSRVPEATSGRGSPRKTWLRGDLALRKKR